MRKTPSWGGAGVAVLCVQPVPEKLILVPGRPELGLNWNVISGTTCATAAPTVPTSSSSNAVPTSPIRTFRFLIPSPSDRAWVPGRSRDHTGGTEALPLALGAVTIAALPE